METAEGDKKGGRMQTHEVYLGGRYLISLAVVSHNWARYNVCNTGSEDVQARMWRRSLL